MAQHYTYMANVINATDPTFLEEAKTDPKWMNAVTEETDALKEMIHGNKITLRQKCHWL